MNPQFEIMGLLIFFLALALGVSFLCSILEAVLLSISSPYIASETNKGHANGHLWASYKSDIDRPLAAILSLNTIAHTIGAAGVGSQATTLFGEVYFGVISIMLTLLILVLSEIIPKTLGALYWRRLAPICAHLLRFVLAIMYPFVVTAQQLTKAMANGHKPRSISREEFTALAEVGVKEGIFVPEESKMLQSLIRFHGLCARDIMTPRPVFFSLSETDTVDQVLHENDPIRFSRIPIYHGQRDNFTGFIRKDELLIAAVKTPGVALEELKRELLAVPETYSLSLLLSRMLESREQMTLVVDEYGEVLGLVTIEDLVETMLGLEIVDETDTSIDMQAMARELWVKRAKQLGVVSEEYEEHS